MDNLYSSSQPYQTYNNPPWPEEVKSDLVANDNSSGPSSDPLTLETASSKGSCPAPDHTRPPPPPPPPPLSMLKTENDFAGPHPMWSDRSHEPQPVYGPCSVSNVPLMDAHAPHLMRMHDPALSLAVQHPQSHPHPWPVVTSESSTPTPLYGPSDAYGHPLGYGPPVSATYPAYPADPSSAVSMSPQSSQGGWTSNNSSDGTDHRANMLQSPLYRPASPTTVVRPDGIRKKNARFEIPKERNLANIDAMIMASTDDGERKELKQQKRLLRNRQAALDSRQRKKTHTEKLEQEKKVNERKMMELEEGLARAESQISIDRESWLQQRQQLEHVIHTLQYDRDEAIRTKTLETGELRRQVSFLKDIVRDLERQNNKGYAAPSDVHNFSNDLPEFGLDDGYDDYSFINGDDYKMDDAADADAMHRQATPRPPPVQVADKSDAGFSWNTFYMCLLFGAFIASSGNGQGASNSTTSAIASSISPAEAGNVLKAVLKSGTESEPGSGLMPTQVQAVSSVSSDVQTPHRSPFELGPTSGSTLDVLHQTLSMPTRQQEMASAFSLSTSAYNHINDPFNEHLNDSDANLLQPPKPSPLQQAWATMQAETDERERSSGISAKVQERSLLWDRVPPEVVKNFEELVRKSGGLTIDEEEKKMDH